MKKVLVAIAAVGILMWISDEYKKAKEKAKVKIQK